MASGRNFESQALYERTGKVMSDSKLVSFLYDLMRDHLPTGIVEELVLNAQATPVNFTNGLLAKYAMDVAARLSAIAPTQLEFQFLVNSNPTKHSNDCPGYLCVKGIEPCILSRGHN